jgi:hypothetical protein
MVSLFVGENEIRDRLERFETRKKRFRLPRVFILAPAVILLLYYFIGGILAGKILISFAMVVGILMIVAVVILSRMQDKISDASFKQSRQDFKDMKRDFDFLLKERSDGDSIH